MSPQNQIDDEDDDGVSGDIADDFEEVGDDEALADVDRQIVGLQDWDTILLMADAPYLIVRREALLQARVHLKDYLNARGIRCSDGQVAPGIKRAASAGILTASEAEDAASALRLRNRWAYYENSGVDAWDHAAAESLRAAVLAIGGICAPRRQPRYAELSANALTSAGLEETPAASTPARTARTALTPEQLREWREAWQALAIVALGAAIIAVLVGIFSAGARGSNSAGETPRVSPAPPKRSPGAQRPTVWQAFMLLFSIAVFLFAIGDCILGTAK